MWRFRELERGVPERDPHEAEFFRLTEPSEAVVREIIQNSLDAKIAGGNKVKVTFSFGELDKDNVMDYFNGLESHLKACNLLPPDYKEGNRVSFLTIEDFGTTGLDGITGEDGSRPEKGNNFFDFWWREGMSGKSGGVAGRWGLGKTTFHIASRLRSFWGLTVRQDDHRKLLMGKALLKTHRIGDSVYHYYGYFTAEDYKPLSEQIVIQDFKQKFLLARNDEPGLSLIIPIPDNEINISSVEKAVIIHYFYAIMKGVLEVELKGPCDCLTLNADNLMDLACSQNWQGTPWEGINIQELLQFIIDSMHCENAIELTGTDDENPEITEHSFGDSLAELKDSFNAGNFLSFRIPIMIRKINEQPSRTYFDIYLKKYPQLRQSEEFFVRSGITISGIKTIGNRPVRGLFVAEDEPVTAFLGDCENPHHTDWNERTGGFKEKYENSARTLRFIKKSMVKIVSILDRPPQERQVDFLKEIFSIPERTSEEVKDRIRQPDIPKIHRKPAIFEITSIRGGFKISLSRNDISFPVSAKVTVAYDVRRGNPFKQYEINDFDLASSSISIRPMGCAVLRNNRNIMEIQVTGSDFDLEVTGFDPKRDLVINVKEESDETQV
jgi:hypothetical protein